MVGMAIGFASTTAFPGYLVRSSPIFLSIDLPPPLPPKPHSTIAPQSTQTLNLKLLRDHKINLGSYHRSTSNLGCNGGDKW